MATSSYDCELLGCRLGRGYDDALPAASLRPEAEQLALAIGYSPPQPPDDPDQLRLDLSWPAAEPPEDVGRVPATDRAATGRLIVAVVEVLNRQRPLPQLQPHLAPAVYGALQVRLWRTPSPPGLARVRSLHTYQPAADAIEAAATVEHGTRASALAARLQRRTPGWLCTVLHLL